MVTTADDRRQRLAALRAEAISSGAIDDQEVTAHAAADDECIVPEDGQDRNPELKFRNYRPRAKELAELHVGGTPIPDVEKATSDIRLSAQKPQVIFVVYALFQELYDFELV